MESGLVGVATWCGWRGEGAEEGENNTLREEGLDGGGSASLTSVGGAVVNELHVIGRLWRLEDKSRE